MPKQITRQIPYKAVSKEIPWDHLLSRCSPHAKLLYLMLYLDSDGEMQCYSHPEAIKARCFSRDRAVDDNFILSGLDELERRRRISFYYRSDKEQECLHLLGNSLPTPITNAILLEPPPGSGG